MIQAKGEQVRVLTVDDEPDDRAMVRRKAEALFPVGEIIEAGSREDFEAVLSGPAFDLVVTDLELKWSTGHEVLARVRECFPFCPVVMFTDSGDETTAVELMKAGLDDDVVNSARQLPRLRTSMKIAVENARNRSALSTRERQLADALAHERTIVRELDHRVKNNIQTMASILGLRARSRGGEVAAELEDLAGGIRALGLMQSRIYDGETLHKVEFAAALGDMTRELARLHADREVALALDLPGPLALDVARAMPLGLLCYEIILNALQHAWPLGSTGSLDVTAKRMGSSARILVGDDGVGLEGDLRKGVGTQLSHALATEAQVEIEVRSTPGEGTTMILRLTLQQTKSRNRGHESVGASR